MIQHLRAMQKESALLVIAIVLSLLLVGISSYYRDGVEQNKKLANEALSAARVKYNDARDRKKLLEEFEQRYKKLEQDGIVGEEQRLNWVDLIESISSQYGLSYVKYRIEKQQRVNDPGISELYPEIDVYRSKMKIEMQLLHEVDIYRLLNTLDVKANGLFDIENCAIKRNNTNYKTIIEETTGNNFSADCVLNWYTLVQSGTYNYADGGNENEEME